MKYQVTICSQMVQDKKKLSEPYLQLFVSLRLFEKNMYTSFQ